MAWMEFGLVIWTKGRHAGPSCKATSQRVPAPNRYGDLSGSMAALKGDIVTEFQWQVAEIWVALERQERHRQENQVRPTNAVGKTTET